MIWLLASLAQGGGYYFSDPGIVASGRAGAWIAGADTQFAQYHNPAGIIRVDAPTVTVGLSGVRQAVQFERVDAAGDRLEEARNGAPAFGIPQLGFATPLGDDFGFAFGFTSPFAPTNEWDPRGAQRYSMIESTIWQFSVGPSLAWRAHDALTVGASVGGQALRLDDRLKVTTRGPDGDGRDVETADIDVQANTWDTFNLWWNVGLLIEPHERVSIGLSMTPPTKHEARGPGSLDFTEHALAPSLDMPVWEDEDITILIDLPVVLRAGVAVRPTPSSEIELAVVWEDWSSLADLQIEDIDVTVTSESLGFAEEVPPTLSLPSDFRDSVSVRLGGEVRVMEELELRGGLMWDRGALAPADLSVALVDPWKVQASTGATGWFADGRVRVDGMASYVAYPTLDIADSTVTQVTVPVLQDDIEGSVVGNGRVRSQGWTVGIRAGWVFTGKARSTPRATTRAPGADLTTP